MARLAHHARFTVGRPGLLLEGLGNVIEGGDAAVVGLPTEDAGDCTRSTDRHIVTAHQLSNLNLRDRLVDLCWARSAPVPPLESIVEAVTDLARVLANGFLSELSRQRGGQRAGEAPDERGLLADDGFLS